MSDQLNNGSMFMFNLLHNMKFEEVKNPKKYDHTTYGVLVFNEKMEITECNYLIKELLGEGTLEVGCEGKMLSDVLNAINERTIANNIQIKAVMVLSANCAAQFNGYHMPSDKLSTIVDQTGTVVGGTVIIRNKTK